MLSEVAKEFDIAMNAATNYALTYLFPRATMVRVTWPLPPWPGR
jgi:hypothetical protein